MPGHNLFPKHPELPILLLHFHEMKYTLNSHKATCETLSFLSISDVQFVALLSGNAFVDLELDSAHKYLAAMCEMLQN
jgi:hypothetical protein